MAVHPFRFQAHSSSASPSRESSGHAVTQIEAARRSTNGSGEAYQRRNVTKDQRQEAKARIIVVSCFICPYFTTPRCACQYRFVAPPLRSASARRNVCAAAEESFEKSRLQGLHRFRARGRAFFLFRSSCAFGGRSFSQVMPTRHGIMLSQQLCGSSRCGMILLSVQNEPQHRSDK